MGMLHSLRRSQQALKIYSQQTVSQIDKTKNKKNKKKFINVLSIIRDLYF